MTPLIFSFCDCLRRANKLSTLDTWLARSFSQQQIYCAVTERVTLADVERGGEVRLITVIVRVPQATFATL